ncbi:MAG: aminotransferase class I/II-fold pyridoxal phosphate-dependent enzyme, partial [Verrucomicrobia bacterium]|nr:aminotransferase class I/II-fold pyridoxal phosphate-dependent enzyme [Verrucomicrobiota bacterium]
AQMGAVAALNGSQDHLPVWLQEYSRRRTYIYERLNQMPGVSCVNAKGAFYLFPNISATGMKSVEFAARLLEEEKVAVVPGIAFGSDANIRLSYATSMQLIEKGMDRMERFCKKIAK